MRRIFVAGWFWFAVLLVLVSPEIARGQDQTRGFTVRLHRDAQGGLHKYVLFVPQGYTPEKRWPAILYLHGAGECGTDGLKPTTMGIAPYVKQREANFPFFVIFPQCEDQSGRILTRWSPESEDGKRALKILDEVQQEYSVDSKKTVLTGWSMGGYGAWSHWLAAPERWSAVVPIAGGLVDPSLIEKEKDRLRGSHIWAFHGTLDNLIQKTESQKVMEALKGDLPDASYTELANGDHGVWRQIYASDELYRWMSNPESKPDQQVIAAVPLSTAVPPGPFSPAISNEPFVNALYIPKAITVRLGNDSLAAVSDAIPGMVPKETLSGGLGDMYDTTSASGRTFSVQMSGITYSTTLHRVLAQAHSSGEISLQVGLKRIDMQIGGTYISGGPRAASVGPIAIAVGIREPVWLHIHAKPRIEAGKIKFDLTRVDFDIQHDNWSYSQPGGISTRGLGMTQDRVYDGVMSGMASSKPRIESQVKSLVPSLVAQLEQRIEYSQFDQLIAGMWPLPMVMPRVLSWPQEIKADGNGVTLTLGATVGAITETQKKAKPRWAKLKEAKPLNLSRERSLYVGINPQILDPISEMAIEGGESKINVLDTPSRTLATLADLKTMSEVIPALKQQGDDVELTSELILRKAVGFSQASASGSAENSGAGGNGATRLAVDVPELTIRVSVKPRSHKTPPKAFAELVLSLKQSAEVALHKPDFQTRVLQMKWLDAADVKAEAKFADDSIPDKTVDAEKWKQIVVDGWYEFTDAGHAARMVIPDVQVGVARLRAAQLRDDGGLLGVAFGAPPMFIANRTELPIRYETKIMSSDWSPSYTIKKGERLRFNVPTDMLVRLHDGDRVQEFNLPAGSSNVYRSIGPNTPATLYAEAPQEHLPATDASETSLNRDAGDQQISSGKNTPPPPAE